MGDHVGGEERSGLPDHTKEGPTGGRDSERLGRSVWVAELLPVAQCAEVDVVLAEDQRREEKAERFDGSAWCCGAQPGECVATTMRSR
jgi:hypothetical protein